MTGYGLLNFKYKYNKYLQHINIIVILKKATAHMLFKKALDPLLYRSSASVI